MCHIGPNFTDEKLHNTGVAWNGERFTDLGAGRGDFKTPTLREVARTAPYMHDGSLTSLDDVTDFYDRGGNRNPSLAPEMQPLNLTMNEKHALVSFLRSLSGDVLSGLRSAVEQAPDGPAGARGSRRAGARSYRRIPAAVLVQRD
jgi:cytochrome c peroxidase